MSGIALGIGTVAAAGIGAYSSYANSKAIKGSQGQLYTPEKNAETDALNKLKLDYSQQAYGSYNAGETPESFVRLRQNLETQQAQNQYSRMYGGGGMQGPGVMQGVTDAGAATGIGDKAMMAGMKKAYWDYLQNSQAFDTEMSKLEYQSGQDDINRAHGTQMQNPYAPTGYIPGTQPQQGYDWGKTAGDLSDAIGDMDWNQNQNTTGYGYNDYVGMEPQTGQSFRPSTPPSGYNLNVGPQTTSAGSTAATISPTYK